MNMTLICVVGTKFVLVIIMTLTPFVQVRRYQSFLEIRIAPTESHQRPFHGDPDSLHP